MSNSDFYQIIKYYPLKNIVHILHWKGNQYPPKNLINPKYSLTNNEVNDFIKGNWIVQITHFDEKKIIQV